jgi:hypothetical protein
MLQMYGGGIILCSRDGVAERLQAEAASLWAHGPGPVDPEDLEDWRYRLTDALDDLADLTDGYEIAMCAAGVLECAGDLVCARAGRWVGRNMSGGPRPRQPRSHRPPHAAPVRPTLLIRLYRYRHPHRVLRRPIQAAQSPAER